MIDMNYELLGGTLDVAIQSIINYRVDNEHKQIRIQ